jgi:hypothetical protein
MFLNSSKSIKSKIIAAAIKTDEDYRMHRPAEKISQEKPASSPVQTICHNVIY